MTAATNFFVKAPERGAAEAVRVILRAMPRAWLASTDEAEHVARLMIAFRDWWGRDWPDDDTFAAGVRRLLDDDQTEFLLAAADGEPCGVVQLRYRYGVWYDAPDCELEDLYVDPAGRGRGVARALVERARERGCRRIQLDANAANEPAQRLYRSLGFTSFSDPPGGEDLLMRRRL
jgi:ribosomal protein S18 acetylase RimI-like enzyme